MLCTSPFFLAVALGLCLVVPVRAQVPAANALQQTVSLRSETAPPTPVNTTDSDLGEVDAVQKIPKPETFTASTTQQLFYTDNVFYTNAHQVASPAYLGSYSVSVVPYSLGNWTPRIGLQYNMVRYGNAAEGDFDNESANFSSQYIFTDDRSWSWTPSVTISRFTTPHANDHEFYEEAVYDNQISHVMEISKSAHVFLVGAYDLAYHQANPALYDRVDNALSFSLAWYPVQEVKISGYIRPSWYIYETNQSSVQHDRDDFNISEGLDVTYTPYKYFSISADVLHSNDYSNNSGMSYNNTIPGLSLSGTVKF